MIESGLFGHTRGAFTGAISKRLGCFKLADGGTLFLDEIGDMSLSAQTKILRAVEYKEIIPVGCDKPETVDVRLICATHQDLSRLISDGRFREDLYYRIGIIELYLPSLDERREDIPVLAKHFLERLNAAYKKQCRLSADGHDYLLNRNWPGNVRELQGLMERSVIYAGRDIITADDLYDNAGRSLEDNPSFLPELGNGFHLKNYMDHINRQLYKKALAQTNNNQSRAAELLGVSPQSVSQFIQKNKNR
jgi:transcriptional regulator with GAF, ATPase, and Fis domain